MDALLFMVALVAYLAVAGVRLGDPETKPPWLPFILDGILAVGLVAHAAALGLGVYRTGELPVHSAGPSIASLAMVVGIGALALRPRKQGEILAGVHVALVAVLLGLSLLMPVPTHNPEPALASVWLPIHAVSTFLGISSFGLAFGISIVYLKVRQRLKSKKLAGLGRLPAIDTLDRLNTHCILAGFLALTVGIASGGLWAFTKETGPSGLGPTVWATLLAWGWYAAAVLVRVVGGWRGKVAAQFSVVGFAGMVLSLGGILIALQGWHG
ncbi:MAG: cytochrome c biogenesis protein CcsA [Proteobacteria bacterium]|nr:cytochrome c biogenesis protein CcsA [Pseudomonadota bacterium]MCP4918077.1 cytochrome c biogenesis protein CcsA [Pseudomonadota bacterium]